jgi:hypothetical protein
VLGRPATMLQQRANRRWHGAFNFRALEIRLCSGLVHLQEFMTQQSGRDTPGPGQL